MAINTEQEVREVSFFSNNPEYAAKQPELRIFNPAKPKIDQLVGTHLFTTTLRFKVETPFGSRGITTENREAKLVAESESDIVRLAAEPHFKAPQLVTIDPEVREKDWDAFVWLAPRDKVLFETGEGEPQIYLQRLMTGQIPWVDSRRVGEDYYAALARVASDNSQYIRKLDEPAPKPGPLSVDDLKALADKYDVSAPYQARFAGMLLNFINLEGKDMITHALLDPKERAEHLAIVDRNDQSGFLHREAEEGFKELLLLIRDPRKILALNDISWLGFSSHPTSDNDMEQQFNRIDEGGLRYTAAVTRKLLFGVNLSTPDLLALSRMSPLQRLGTLVQSDRQTAYDLATEVAKVRRGIPERPEGQRLALATWFQVDKVRAVA